MSLVHPSQIVDSIQPVITKCKIDNDELDIDVIRTEIEEVIADQIPDNPDE